MVMVVQRVSRFVKMVVQHIFWFLNTVNTHYPTGFYWKKSISNKHVLKILHSIFCLIFWRGHGLVLQIFEYFQIFPCKKSQKIRFALLFAPPPYFEQVAATCPYSCRLRMASQTPFSGSKTSPTMKPQATRYQVTRADGLMDDGI